jgi:hypothetical protein
MENQPLDTYIRMTHNGSLICTEHTGAKWEEEYIPIDPTAEVIELMAKEGRHA